MIHSHIIASDPAWFKWTVLSILSVKLAMLLFIAFCKFSADGPIFLGRRR